MKNKHKMASMMKKISLFWGYFHNERVFCYKVFSVFMVRQHSDHILAWSEAETIPVANDDWINLLNIQMLYLALLYDILQDYPFHQSGMNLCGA